MELNKKVLVVDDAATNIEILLELLGNTYDVMVAINGNMALEIAAEDNPDLILLDILMPDMDGYEVCKRLKENEITKNIPVIFITAKTDEESMETAFLCGGVDYVTKPFNPRELLSRVNTHLQLKMMMNHLESIVEKEISKRKEQEKLLEHQTKMAAMGEMMDAVAHQWKQPLNALNMYGDLIKDDFEEGNINQSYISQFSDDIHLQIEHMVNTLDEFRTFFRPNKENENFQLLDVVTSVLFLTKDEFLKHSISVNIEQEDSIELFGSKNEFKHLVLNIINNAKDAFIDNGIKNRMIKIRLIHSNENDRLEIEDNAGGIPEEVILNIFKANVTTKSEGKGTGIGLYMSTQIANKFNAKLSVKNKKEGACFFVRFPQYF